MISEFVSDISAEELDNDYDLLENGVVNSLGLLRLIAWVGERYDIPVDEIDLSPADFRSVNSIDEFVASVHPVGGRA
ncbi:acyl carrier protein [Umezawaea sp. NPDC059074]|uniref:acyl carrier protein n=1 Tax=Umezawaea sp. NPDC059074 TaxID=3346716 RepID=UPI003679C511